MTTTEIEKRLLALEAEIADLKSPKKRVNPTNQRNPTNQQNPWWDKIAGVFADNPRFEHAMRTARETPEPRPSKPARAKPRRPRPRTPPKAAK